MEPHRYILYNDHGRTKGFCPACGRPKVFSRVLDTATREFLPDHVGICDRINSCGYNYTAKQYFDDNKAFAIPSNITPGPHRKAPLPQKPTEYIERDLYMKSFNYGLKNNFISFLEKNFEIRKVVEAINKYNIGTSTYYQGGTVFWQFDLDGNCRYGKVFVYNPDTGKRNKEYKPTPVHTILKRYDFNHSQCLFGLQLVKDFEGSAVNVCESEKTAIIASIALPNELWLACGGIHLLNYERLSPFKGKTILLHPDLGAFDIWNEKANLFRKQGLDVRVVDLLESIGNEEQRAAGWDIADYIIEQNCIKQ